MFVKTKNNGMLNVKNYAGFNIFEIIEFEDDDSAPFSLGDKRVIGYNLSFLVRYDKYPDEGPIILETNTKKDAEKALQSLCDSLRAGDIYWSPNDMTQNDTNQRLAALHALEDRKRHYLTDIVKQVAHLIGEPDADCSPGTTIYKTCGSSLNYWKNKGFIENPEKGIYQITQSGIDYINNLQP